MGNAIEPKTLYYFSVTSCHYIGIIFVKTAVIYMYTCLYYAYTNKTLSRRSLGRYDLSKTRNFEIN